MNTESGSTLEELLDEVRENSILFNNIKIGLRALRLDRNYMLAALKIKNCNGSTGYGVPFSTAFCDTAFFVEKEHYPFASIFTRGIYTLNKCLDNPNHAAVLEDSLRIILTRLLTFLHDRDNSMEFVRCLEHTSNLLLKNKAGISVAIAEHIVAKLTLKGTYALDKRNQDDDDVCKCGCSTLIRDKYGNTTIGEKSVWHGPIDIISGCSGQEVPVLVAGKDEEVEIHGDSAPIEMKFKSMKEVEMKEQIIAQTIVFSFLQRNRHPSVNHCLFPAIGISPQETFFFFYDAELDVLLQSATMPLQFEDSACYSTLIAIWLVLNYRYLGSGLTGELRNLPKADYFTVAKSMLPVYRDHLSVGDLGHSVLPSEVHPLKFDASKFVWPRGVDECLDLPTCT